jgi:WD40 repeat protein
MFTPIALSADGQLAVSASFDNTLRVWNLESGECLKVLEGHEGSVTSLFLSADGQLAISVSGGAFSSDNTLRIWNLESGKCLTQFFIRGIASFTLHPRFQKMVIGFTTGRVEFFDIENSK